MFRAPNKRGPLQALGKATDKTQRARMLEGTGSIMRALDHKRWVNAESTLAFFKYGEMDRKSKGKE